jgi:ABC-type Fe3+-hydroxamate transport system substrate-binding protein
VPHPVGFPTCIALAVFLAACSSNPQPATPAPEAAPAAAPAAPAAASAAAPSAAQPQSGQPNLTGDWEVRIVSSQGGALNTLLRLASRGDGYAGVMQPLQEGERPYFVRGFQMNGQQITITLETEDGEARVQGVLRGANQLEGSFTSRRLVGRLTALRR